MDYGLYDSEALYEKVLYLTLSSLISISFRPLRKPKIASKNI